jgi:hypothetical protein
LRAQCADAKSFLQESVEELSRTLASLQGQVGCVMDLTTNGTIHPVATGDVSTGNAPERDSGAISGSSEQ